VCVRHAKSRVEHLRNLRILEIFSLEPNFHLNRADRGDRHRLMVVILSRNNSHLEQRPPFAKLIFFFFNSCLHFFKLEERMLLA